MAGWMGGIESHPADRPGSVKPVHAQDKKRAEALHSGPLPNQVGVWKIPYPAKIPISSVKNYRRAKQVAYQGTEISTPFIFHIDIKQIQYQRT